MVLSNTVRAVIVKYAFGYRNPNYYEIDKRTVQLNQNNGYMESGK